MKAAILKEANCHCLASLRGDLISSEDYDNGLEAAASTQINPYQFEPYISNTDESEVADEDDEEERLDRLTDNSW